MSIPDSAEKFDLTSEDYRYIWNSYKSLWGLFRNTTGIEVKGTGDDLDISHKDGEKVTVESNGVLRIKGVDFEAGGSTGPIDICFKPDLVVIGVEYNGTRQPVIESSATAVSYLRIREAEDTGDGYSDGRSPAEVLSAFHYDFDMDPDDRHPVFHMQYEPSSIQIGTLNSEYDIQNECHVTSTVPNHPRVPTAPLDFAGVLYMLIQEHIESFDTAWPNGTINAVEKIPKIPAWCFEPNPLCGGAMLPEWWYLLSRDEEHIPNEIVESRGIL